MVPPPAHARPGRLCSRPPAFSSWKSLFQGPSGPLCRSGARTEGRPRESPSHVVSVSVCALTTQPSSAGPLAPPPGLPTVASLVGSQPWVAAAATPEPSSLRPWRPTSLTGGPRVDVGMDVGLDVALAGDLLPTWRPVFQKELCDVPPSPQCSPDFRSSTDWLLFPRAWRLTEVRPESFLCSQLPGRGHARGSAWRALQGGTDTGWWVDGWMVDGWRDCVRDTKQEEVWLSVGGPQGVFTCLQAGEPLGCTRSRGLEPVSQIPREDRPFQEGSPLPGWALGDGRPAGLAAPLQDPCLSAPSAFCQQPQARGCLGGASSACGHSHPPPRVPHPIRLAHGGTCH